MSAAFLLLLIAVGASRDEADRLWQAGRYSEAADAYFALLQGNPRDASLLEAMGQTLLRLHRPDGAIGFFRQELVVQPANREALRSLGAALQEANVFEEGRAVLQQATASEPLVGANWFRLGLLMYQNAYYPAAIGDFDRALALGIAERNRAEVVRAISLLQTGREAEVLQTIPGLLDRPENTQNLDLMLAYVQALSETGNYAEALSQDATALAAAPANANAHFWRARILQQQSRIQEAVQEAEKARALSPTSPAPRNLLVRLYRKLGRDSDAETEADWLRRAEAASNGRQTIGPPR